MSLSEEQHLKDNATVPTEAKDLTELREEVRFLRCAQQELTAKLESAKQEAAGLNAVLAAHTAEIEQTHRAFRCSAELQRAVLEAELMQLRRKFYQQCRELGARESSVSLLSANLAETKQALKAVTASWSWRITKPLRFSGSMLLLIARLPRVVHQRLFHLRAYAEYVWWCSRLRNCHLFDSAFYLERNPDVANSRSRSNPMLHFFLFGAAERRSPHPLFDVKHYLEQNPDVAHSGINPLLHYVCWGAKEGRDPHPLFDSHYYLEKYADVGKEHWNPLVHYMDRGAAAGLEPNPTFRLSEYLERNPIVAREGLNPLVHYVTTHGSEPIEGVPSDDMKPTETPLRASLRRAFLMHRRRFNSAHESSPLVSVIIPYFNQGDYLEDALLSSCLACSYPIEIIVVDDGSTHSQSILAVDELRARYDFRLIRQANSGLPGARNAGLRMAQGKFIQFLDADDFLGPDKIDIQIKEFDSDPNTDICLCEYDATNADGEVRHRMNPSTIAGFSLSREDFLLRWERGLSIPIHCALFRREVIEKIEFRTITQSGKEDWIFWIEVLSKPRKFHFNPAVLATYRIHGNNATRNYERMGLDFLRASIYLIDTGLCQCNEFLQASLDHFQAFYLPEIKKEALIYSPTSDTMKDVHDKSSAG